jgi:hypothetical protein
MCIYRVEFVSVCVYVCGWGGGGYEMDELLIDYEWGLDGYTNA